MARSRTGRRSPFPDRITSVGCNPPRNRTDVEVGRQKRAAQLLGKDVGVRAIDRRRESYSVSDRFLTLAGAILRIIPLRNFVNQARVAAWIRRKHSAPHQFRTRQRIRAAGITGMKILESAVLPAKLSFLRPATRLTQFTLWPFWPNSVAENKH